MKYLDLTLSTPAANLACDEALLNACEQGAGEEILRFWQPDSVFVVAGYANRLACDVNLESCRKEGVPLLRRCSGGGTVLQAPGCLNYSLILRIDEAGPLGTITGTNVFVLERHRQLFTMLLGKEVHLRGDTDLALGERKFSGNAQRRRRQYLLFHGAILLNLDLELIERYLNFPSKAPAYRAGRGHTDFLTNVDISAEQVKEALRHSWQAHEPATDVPHLNPLLLDKYSSDEWTYRF